MEEPLQFSSLFDLVCSEVETRGESLRTISDATIDRILEAVEKSVLMNLPLTLAEPVRAPDGKADLVTGGSDLSQRLVSLLRLQFKDRSQAIGPIVLEAAPQLLDHFRGKIRGELKPLIERAQAAENVHYTRVYRGLSPEGREMAQEAVQTIVKRALSTPTGILMTMSLLRRKDGDSLWEKALTACFLSMAVLGSYGAEEVSSDKPEALARVGGAAMFMDAALMLNASLYDADSSRHAIRSAQIVRDLNLDESTADAVANHHTTEGEGGKPIFRSDSATLSVFARVLVVVNLFVGTILGEKARGREIEVIKLLNYLAAEGHVDPRAVKTLTKLYLSEQYAIFMDHANSIKNQCAYKETNQAILWNILGERNPYKFICQQSQCAQLGSQVTTIATTVPIVLDGQVVSKIHAGSYVNCKHLTDALAKLHKEMASLK